MGLFSWHTIDTDRSICCDGNRLYKTFTVYLHSSVSYKGQTKWKEDTYQGYGIFGGVDYYVIMALMNGKDGDDEFLRYVGVELYYSGKQGLKYPVLTECEEWNGGFDKKPRECEAQGFFYDDEPEVILEMLPNGYLRKEQTETDRVFAFKLNMICGKKRYKTFSPIILEKTQIDVMIKAGILTEEMITTDEIDDWYELCKRK